jgi:carboxyl-terminal processing protease
VRRGWTTAVLLLWTARVVPSLWAVGGEPPDALRRQAQQWEASGQWSKASQVWEQVYTKSHDLYAKERYQNCLRRAQLVRRHQDASYQDQVLALSLQESLEVYSEILSKLKTDYVDADRVDVASLYRQGVEELRLALADDGFRQNHLPDAQRTAVQVFQEELVLLWVNKPVRRLEDALAQVKEVAFAANQALGLRPTLVVSEFACGACNALDEYTYFLTPGQYRDLNACWRGEIVGIGIDVAVDNQRQLTIGQVLPDSPAQAEGLKVHDRVLKIGDKPAANLPVETAHELLKGKPDTTVELEVLGPGDARPRKVTLKRQVLHIPSVAEKGFLDRALGIGYVQILGFQETTLQELDLAIVKLQAAGMKVLILDLRGNLGGLFDVARQVVGRFLSAGIVVSTQGAVSSEYNVTYYAQSMNPLTVPLVVLVDGLTASSAEMVAGALKENQRGKLVGKTTFGKGSIQKVRRLSTVPAGIRMTVAKFYSPRGLPYDGAGVAPHLDVAGAEIPVDPEQDPQVQAALEVARPLAMGQPD